VAGVSFPARGEIYWVNLDPTVGTEIAKRRPALVISNDIGNEHSPRVIAAPISTLRTERRFPFEVSIPTGEGGLSQTSKVLLSQIRTVDKRRLDRYVGKLPPERILEVDEAIRLSLSV
jgi:mRNA interferase MazF